MTTTLGAVIALLAGALARDILADLVKPRADRIAARFNRRRRRRDAQAEQLRLLRRIEKQNREILRRLPAAKQ